MLKKVAQAMNYSLLFYIYYSISSNPQYVLIYCLRLDLKASVYNLYNISHFEYEVNTVVAKILFFINKKQAGGVVTRVTHIKQNSFISHMYQRTWTLSELTDC